MLRHSVRSAGRTARAQVHFKVTRKKRHERTAAPGKGSAGQQRARPGRGCREPAGRCPAPPSTHRRGCRIPSGGTWCAALLCPWRLSQHRGPRALSGAFIGSRQLHALLCGQRRGGECGRGRRETPLGAERAVPYNPPSAAELLRARRRAPPAGRRAVRGGSARPQAGRGCRGCRGPVSPRPLRPPVPPPPSRPPSAHRAPAGAARRRDLERCRRQGQAARREPVRGGRRGPECGVREGAGVRPCVPRSVCVYVRVRGAAGRSGAAPCWEQGEKKEEGSPAGQFGRAGGSCSQGFS